jgi:SNF2 family DNA or RNA helicase
MIRDNWIKQIETHIDGGFNLMVWKNAEWRKKKWAGDSAPYIYLVNHEAFALPRENMVKVFKVQCPRLVAIDESISIKNHKAKRTKNIVKILGKAPHRTIATGIDFTKDPLDLFTQLEFIAPGSTGEKNYYSFENRYTIKKAMLMGGRRFDQIIGFRNLDTLMQRIGPYVYRKTRDECLDLPGWQDELVDIEMTPEQKSVYKGLKRELLGVLESGAEISAVNAAAMFTKLRQASGCGVLDSEHELQEYKADPKADYLLSDLEDVTEQAIIFCEYRHEAEHLIKRFGGRAGLYMGGSGGHGLDAFLAGDIQFLVATSSAGGVGLNLQCAALMYFYSVGTFFMHEQARARIYRDGQTRKCVYKYLLASKMDRHMLQMVHDKKDLADALKAGPEAIRKLLEDKE